MNVTELQDPWDSDAPVRVIDRPLLEKDVQEKCVTWARARGWWARKFSSPANRSVPDYIFGRDGCTIFVEFKAPGKKATDSQKDEHEKMAAVGLMVHVIDDVDNFKRLFTCWEKQIADSVLVHEKLAPAKGYAN